MKKCIDLCVTEKEYTILNKRSVEWGITVEEVLRRFICGVNILYLPYKEVLLLVEALLAYIQQRGVSQDVDETIEKLTSLSMLLKYIKTVIRSKEDKMIDGEQNDLKQHIKLEVSEQEYGILKEKCKIANMDFLRFFVKCMYEMPVITFSEKEDLITGLALRHEAINYPSESTLMAIKDEVDRQHNYLSSLLDEVKEKYSNR